MIKSDKHYVDVLVVWEDDCENSSMRDKLPDQIVVLNKIAKQLAQTKFNEDA